MSASNRPLKPLRAPVVRLVTTDETVAIEQRFADELEQLSQDHRRYLRTFYEIGRDFELFSLCDALQRRNGRLRRRDKWPQYLKPID